jgi:hypothetical protein
MYIGLNLTTYTPCYCTATYHLWIIEHTAESIDRAELAAFICVCVRVCVCGGWVGGWVGVNHE